MFGKLFKYEIKAAGKWYLMTYLVIIGLSLFFGLVMKAFLGDNYDNIWVSDSFGDLRTNLQIFSFIALTILAAALTLATFFLVINRFYQNVYGREGYLTMTLPVSSHQIILSKLVAASFWMFLSTLTCIISFFLYFLPSMNLAELLAELPALIADFHEHVPIPLFVSSLFASHLSSILLIYLSISIGQLFQNRRGLMGFVAYFSLYVILSFLNTFITPQSIYDSFFGANYFFYVLVTSVIQGPICYFATNYLLTHRLNIQ